MSTIGKVYNADNYLTGDQSTSLQCDASSVACARSLAYLISPSVHLSNHSSWLGPSHRTILAADACCVLSPIGKDADGYTTDKRGDKQKHSKSKSKVSYKLIPPGTPEHEELTKKGEAAAAAGGGGGGTGR